MVASVKYLTREEIRRLTVPIDNLRDKTLIQLGLVIGCRVSEITTIRLKQLSTRSGTVSLWDEKKNRFRVAVFDQATGRLIDEYLASGSWVSKPYVPWRLFYFSNKTANRILKHWCKVAGINDGRAHWHTLRHTYVVQSLESGVPMNHLVEQTGDSPTTLIRVYGKPSVEARRDMLEGHKYWMGG